MGTSRSTLEILVDVKNAREGAQQLRDVGKAGKDAGGQAEQSGQGFGGLAKNLAVAAGGAVALKKGYGFMKDAANGAAQLAKDTAALTRTTGMDAQTASAWVSIAKNRGIATDTLTRSFTIFSKQLRSVEQGGKAATTAFKDLGISADELKGMNTEQALNATADAFQKLPAGADKAAIAQQLFGRQSQALLPLLNLGSEGLKEQMDIMKKHGLTLDESGVKKGLELAKTQREMKATTEGLKMSIGQALLPAFVAASNALLPLIQGFTWAMQKIPGFNYLVLALAAGLGGLLIASTVASAFAALGITVTAAALPFIAIGVAIAAVVAGLVIAYNKVGWFRAGVDAAFNAIKTVVGAVVGFVKNNLEKVLVVALATPLAPLAAIVLAFRKWDVIKGIISAIIDAVKSLLSPLEKVVEVAGKVGGALGKIGGGIGGALSSINPFQHGGTSPAGGTLALVGERGPELLQLPGGARVTPLQTGTGQPIDIASFAEIHVHLDVEGRELAHVIARTTDEQQQAR